MNGEFISISHIKKVTYADTQKNQGHARPSDDCDKPREGYELYILKVKLLSNFRLFVSPWTNVAPQAPPSMGFSRQEFWSVLPFPSPGDLSDPGIEPRSPALQADAFTSEPPGNPLYSSVRFSSVTSHVRLAPHESQHARPPCPSQTPGVYSNSCPSSW